MKVKPELSQDETFRRNYVLLIAKSLRHCKNHTLDSIDLSIKDGDVIEYHLKDVAARTVLEATSREDCLRLFKSRIERLITSDKEEWCRVIDLVRRQKHLLEQEEIREMHNLSQNFTSPARARAIH